MTRSEGRRQRPPPPEGTDVLPLVAAARADRPDRLRRSVVRLRTLLAARIDPGDAEDASGGASRDLLDLFNDTEALVERYYPDAKPSADGAAILDDLIRTRVAYIRKREKLDLSNRRADIVMKLVGALGVALAGASLAKSAGVL